MCFFLQGEYKKKEKEKKKKQKNDAAGEGMTVERLGVVLFYTFEWLDV